MPDRTTYRKFQAELIYRTGGKAAKALKAAAASIARRAIQHQVKTLHGLKRDFKINGNYSGLDIHIAVNALIGELEAIKPE